MHVYSASSGNSQSEGGLKGPELLFTLTLFVPGYIAHVKRVSFLSTQSVINAAIVLWGRVALLISKG